MDANVLQCRIPHLQLVDSYKKESYLWKRKKSQAFRGRQANEIEAWRRNFSIRPGSSRSGRKNAGAGASIIRRFGDEKWPTCDFRPAGRTTRVAGDRNQRPAICRARRQLSRWLHPPPVWKMNLVVFFVKTEFMPIRYSEYRRAIPFFFNVPRWLLFSTMMIVLITSLNLKAVYFEFLFTLCKLSMFGGTHFYCFFYRFVIFPISIVFFAAIFGLCYGIL